MKTLLDMRKEAASRGQTLFDPGRPCRNGHESMRYVSSGECLACTKEKHARHQKEIHEARQQAATEG